MSTDDELARLVRTLHETQQRILELTDGAVDAVMPPSGTPYLLTPAQEELRRRETEQRWYATQRAAILNALPAHIALLDRAGRIITVNEAWRRFAVANVFPGNDFGIGQNYLEVCESAHGDCSDEAPDAANGIRAVLSGEQPYFALEYPCHSPTEQRWFRLMVTPVEESERSGAVVTHIDITERKLAEDALRDQNTLLANAQRIGRMGSWSMDLRTRRLSWSPETCRLFGIAPEDFDGTFERFLAFILPEDRDRLETALQRAETSDGHLETDYRIRRPDGEVRWLYDRGNIEFDASGAPTRRLGMVMDVTERRTLEEQLRQSQRLESVGQLTGGIAHDFNNLLTVIQGNAELLGEELASDSRLRPLAEMVSTAARRGAELTHRLLAFARKQALDPKPTDTNRLINGMDGLLRRTLGEHIEIELVRGAGLWPALVDPGQLESALLNLALNARDAMPQGGRLTIKTANVELDPDYADRHADVQPGQYVLLAVSDTGTGIAPEHLARVFEPFYTTKEKGKGTGLGLSMVYGFVKQSNGHVTLCSEPGQGTTVKLHLPRVDHAPGEASEGRDDAPVGGHETVLLVEDDALVRHYAEGQLRGLGYRVLSAVNGPEALAILRQRADIDLLFTDIIMPGGMSGRELAEAARALHPGLKVLYTSGYTENAIVHHGRLDPGVQLLGKPYRRAELARMIHSILTDTSPGCDPK